MLVLLLVCLSLCQNDSRDDSRFVVVIFLYLFSSLLAALTAVVMCRLFPQTITLAESTASTAFEPSGFGDAMESVFASIVQNPAAVGFIIGVIQDSMETAINSSGDALFTAAAEYRSWKKRGRSLPKFLGGTTDVELR